MLSTRTRQGAVLAAATVGLIAGLLLPVLTVQKLVLFRNTFSIATGIIALIAEGNIGLGLLIFAFSVVFPIAKLLALWLMWSNKVRGERRQRWLHRLHQLGKWSMLDVFVVALTVVALKLGAVATAEPHLGLWVFATAAILSLVAARQVEREAERSPGAPFAEPEASSVSPGAKTR